MKLSELSEKLCLKKVTENIADTEVSGCYIGDLLSLVMSKAMPNDLWITVQTNINILAVATITEVACILVPEGIIVDEATVAKANLQGINIFSSDKTSYELAKEIGALI